MIALLMKELRASLRDRTGRLLLLSMPALFLFFGFVSVGEPVARGEAPAAWQAGRNLLGVGIVTQTMLVLLLLPPLAATNLVRERERRTLDALLVSPRSAWELGLAKLLSPVALAMGSALLTLPLLVALSLIGGVRPWEPFLVFVIVLLSSLAASALGMAVGALVQGTAGAVIFSGILAVVGCTLTSWTLGRSSVDLLGATFPFGAGSAVLYGNSLSFCGVPVPVLLPSACFLSLLTATFFFASLAALSTPYRRRCLPVRLFGTATLAMLLLLLAASLSPSTSHDDALDASGVIFLLSCVAATLLMAAERLDEAGISKPQPGSAEQAGLETSSLTVRFLLSRNGLALLPWLASLPALSILGGYFIDEYFLSSYRMVLLLGLAFSLGWALFVSGASSLVATRGRQWLEPLLAPLLPAVLLGLGLFRETLGAGDISRWLQPTRVLRDLSDSGTRALDEPHLAAACIAVGLAAALVHGLVALKERRSSPSC